MTLFVKKTLRKAQNHEKVGELALAKELYKQVLAKFPKNKEAIFGYQKLKAGISSTSINAIEPPEDNIQKLLNIYNQGKFQEALSGVKPLINLFPKSTILLNIEGSAKDALNNYQGAVISYKKALEIKPNCAETYFNLGNTFKNMNHFETAVDSYKKAIKNKPDDAEAYCNMGIAYQLKGDLNAAIENYQQAIKLRPDLFVAYNNMGEALQDKGDIDAAIENYREAFKIKDDYAEAYANMGNAFQEKGDLNKSIENYALAINAKPDYLEAYNNMGNAFLDQGDTDRALEIYKQALQIKADYADFHNGMGAALRAKGDMEAAINCYQKAVSIKPDFVKAYTNMGVALKENGDRNAALACYQEALKIQPDHADTHFNLGVFLQEAGNVEEAFKSYKKALKINPKYATAYFNMGNVHEGKGEFKVAMNYYEQAIKVQPNYSLAISNLIYMINLHGLLNGPARFSQICAYTQGMEAPFKLKQFNFDNLLDPDKNLRIGFVSADFRNHPIATYCLQLFSVLKEHSKLTLFAYHNHDTEDHITIETKKYFFKWSSVTSISDQMLAEKIIVDKIDILVDLSNHTKGNRLGVFARKPAPLQVTAMGLPYTTALKAIDYYFGTKSDAWEKKYFSECFLEMATTTAYKPLFNLPDANDLPALKNGFITFGSCNAVSRINRACIGLWSKLLRAIPNSRFVFAGQNDEFLQDQFKKWLLEENVDLSRVDFVSRKKTSEYFNIYHQIDVHLMLRPIAGMTTIADALYMGVPSLGLLNINDEVKVDVFHSLGLDDFLCEDEEDFICQADSLTDKLSQLADIRKHLRREFKSSLFCNPDVAAANWEAALRKIWKRRCAKLDPEPIKLELDNLR